MVKGGTNRRPTRSTTTSGAAHPRAAPIEDLEEPPHDDVFQLVTRPGGARRAQDVVIGFERGVPVSLDGERLGLVELLERAGEIGAATERASWTTSRTASWDSRSATCTSTGRCLILTAHKELEKLVGTIHQNTFKPQLDAHWAYLVYAGLWYEPLLGDLNAHGRGQRAGHRRDLAGSSRARPRCGPALAQRALRPGAGGVRSRAACSPSRRVRDSSSCGACSRGWRTACEPGKDKR